MSNLSAAETANSAAWLVEEHAWWHRAVPMLCEFAYRDDLAAAREALERIVTQVVASSIKLLANTPWTVVMYDLLRVRFVRSSRYMGFADHRSKTLGLSVRMFSQPENYIWFRETILHELAHLIVGQETQSHGPQWQEVAKLLGCSGAPTLKRSELCRAN